MKQDFYKMHGKRSGDVLQELWNRVPGACTFVTNLLTNQVEAQQQPSLSKGQYYRHRKKRKKNDESSIEII